MISYPRYDPRDPYPDSDGQPMAENTQQYRWLVKIKENLEILFADDADVFVAGDLFWYPHPECRVSGPVAPDVMVVVGRPKGDRGSYRQWEEGGIAPQVVFEILSPANSSQEMLSKREFYQRFGVEEYYVYDPDVNHLEIWCRQAEGLVAMSHLNGWTSPRLGIRFALTPQTLELYYPDGQPFLSSIELARRAAEAEQRTLGAKRQVLAAEQQALEAKPQAAQQRQLRHEAISRLRALGLAPEQIAAALSLSPEEVRRHLLDRAD